MPEPMRIKRGKVLGAAVKKRDLELALRALGFTKLSAAIRRLYQPQTEVSKKQLRRK